jgi:hypothetical protein
MKNLQNWMEKLMVEKDMTFRMRQAGFPDNIIQELVKPNPTAWPEGIADKLGKAIGLHKEVGEGKSTIGRVMLLLGPDSPVKDLFAGVIAQHFITNGMRPALVSPERIKETGSLIPAYCVIMDNVSYLSTKDWVVKKAGELLRSHVACGRVLILMAENMADIETAFGTPFMNYISTFGVEIDFPSTRPEMPKL